MRSPRSSAIPTKPAAPSANPTGCTSVARTWTTRATLARHSTGSAQCSSRWDQSGSRAPCSGSRSTPPPEPPRSTRSPACRCQHLGGLTWDQPASPLQHRQFASSTAVPYSTIRPAIFSASLLAAAQEVRDSRTWTGLAGSGRMALIDHRDAAEVGLRVLTDPALWGAHHDLTGPVPFRGPGRSSCFRRNSASPSTSGSRPSANSSSASSAPGYRRGRLSCSSRASGRSSPARTTAPPTFQQITGRPPRPVAEFLHEYRAEFV